MALKPSLTRLTRRIAQAVDEAARSHGLAPGDYALVGSFDRGSDRISLTLGTDRPVDERRLYADILNEIRRVFSPDFPQITSHLGLVIERVNNLDEVYLEGAGDEDELDITEMLART